METILINNAAFVVSTSTSTDIAVAAGDSMSGGYTEDGTIVDPTMGGITTAKDPLLASWPFVIGISSAVLLVSIVLGILLAKMRIKKGIDLYED